VREAAAQRGISVSALIMAALTEYVPLSDPVRGLSVVEADRGEQKGN
jgi:hypothetical protein